MREKVWKGISLGYIAKLCAAALWGAVRNLKGAANFFGQDEILQFFYRNLLGCAAKNFWSLSGCREAKSLKTTGILGRTKIKSPFTKFRSIRTDLISRENGSTFGIYTRKSGNF
jgi:hypothetical protein